MFTVQINPCGVEEISLHSDSEALDDVCLVLWPVVRRHLTQLDRELRTIMGKFIETEDFRGDHSSLN